MRSISYSVVKDTTLPRSLNATRRIMVTVLWAMGGLVVLITALPVPLLFMATAVPFYLSAMLAAMDVALLVALFRFERTPLLVSGAFLSLILISTLAVWLSQVYATTPLITGA